MKSFIIISLISIAFAILWGRGGGGGDPNTWDDDPPPKY